MMRILVLPAILASAAAMPISNLRGALEEKMFEKKEEKPENKPKEMGEEQEKKKEAKAGQNITMFNPVEIDERGPRGHLYYAQTCADCIYKSDGCGCRPAMEYFACLSKHCQDANSFFFAKKCTTLGNKCSGDITISCRGSGTVCESKYNQLPTGGLGFNLDIDADDAYCGPWGKCIGQIKLKVHIKNGLTVKKHNQATKSIFAREASPAPASMAVPAPAAAASPAPGPMAVPAPAPAANDKEEEIWLECGLPKKDHANIDNRQDWILCQKKVKGEKESCKIPMFPELKAEQRKEAYCVLTEGKDGKRLTQPHWSEVINVHEKPESSATTAVVAKKPEEPKENAQNPKKPKPTTAPKKEEGEEEEEEKPKATEAPPVMANMRAAARQDEKEKRAAAKQAADAKKAEEDARKEKVDETEETAEKKEADKSAHGGEHESGLPWMRGK